ncbi:MAG: DegV family protein [Clostridia bacterium]|nr:DegV family protein [Clostridia bacterium]
MSNYVIFTDSACDIKPEILKEWGVYYRPLSLHFDEDETLYSNDEIEPKAFYDKMRSGSIAKTSAVNSEDFISAFEQLLKEGNDILYLGFSSGLSTTYNSARIAADELRESYPDRKIIVVDTLAASAGEGLIVYLTVKKRAEGATLEEAAAFAEDIKFKISIWFTVDDLVYLKRGGRISAASAFFGNMLGIKPVLHMDNEGHLVAVEKVRGRKTSIEALAKKYGELATDTKNNTIFISHADCEDEVTRLATIFEEKYGVKVELITDVGPVIGAHAGPGTIALFFVGKER